MLNHEPPAYRCPFSAFVRGEWDDHNAPTDLVAQEELAFARIAPKWWPDNPRRVAVATREAFGCEGISTRQHNEPAGDQDVWHLHVHVFPRHQGDELCRRHEDAGFALPKERSPWAALLLDRLSFLSVEPVAR